MLRNRQAFYSDHTAIIVLTHKRTTHLRKVLESLSHAKNIARCFLIFACDRPSSEVKDIISTFSHPKKTILILNDAPLSTKHAINRSLFIGMKEAFEEMSCSAVIVIEDDIVVAPDFLDFTIAILNRFAKFKAFRGINLFSRNVAPFEYSDKYVIGSFGLGWGWSINKEMFQQFRKIWSGTEDNHWDFIIEPYCRTGFVINPILSRISNIGMDETATHTKNNDSDKLALEIDLSFKSLRTTETEMNFSEIQFLWSKDYFQFSKYRIVPWSLALATAKLIYLIFGSNTGKTIFSMKCYSLLKKCYMFFGYRTNINYINKEFRRG